MPTGVYPRQRRTILDRLNKLTDKSAGPDACWIWIGCRDKGYGKLHRVPLRSSLAHRLMYEETIGPIPDGLCLLHRCDNRQCVNPAHMMVGTRADNNADMYAKGRNVVLAGERNGCARLSAAQAKQIAQSTGSSIAVGRRFNIDPSQVRKIRRGESWKSATGAAQ